MKRLTRICAILLMALCLFSFIGCKKTTYVVTFDAGDAEFDYAKIQVVKGETIPSDILDNIPTLEGYEFGGWINTADDTVWNKTNKVTSNIDLKARWNKLIKINYVLNGGVNNPNNPTYFTKNVELFAPTKQDFDFQYWLYNGEKITHLPNEDVTEITIEAIFKHQGPQLIYDLDGGTNNPNNPIYYSPNAELFEPTKAGYKFDYWEYNGERVTNIPEVTEGDINLIAHYTIIEYTITYELNGGTNNPNNVTKFTILDLPLSLGDPSMEGMTFMGWTCNGRKIISIPKSSMYCNDITLVATFEKHYNINYVDCDEIDISSFPKTYVSSTGITLPTPIKKGYIFGGWEYDSKIVTKISEGTTGDITISPIFDLATYTITYELNDGKNSIKNPKTYTILDKTINLYNGTRKGYIFVGWMLNGEFVEKIDTSIAENITLSAVWELEPVYHKIIYVLNGGKGDENAPSKYKEGEGLVLSIPTKANAKFLGWNTQSDGSGQYITEISTTATEDITIYAIWEEHEVTHTITYNLNGGEVKNAPETYVQGVGVTLPRATKEGYNFVGWYLTSDFRDIRITEISEEATIDIVLYAKFEEKVTKYTITYYLNGGHFTTEDIVTEFDKNTETFSLPIPTREGYTFTGWINELDDVVTNIEKGTEENIVVKAEYTTTLQSYSIKYITNEGTLSTDAIYKYTQGETVMLPQATREGSTFIGWYRTPNLTGDIYTSIPSSTSTNYVFYAAYQDIGYKITLVVDGVETVINYTINSSNITLDPVEKEGYTFKGWFNDAGQQVDTIESGSHFNIVLIAVFEPIIDDVTHTVTFKDYDGTVFTTISVKHGNTVSEIIAGTLEGLSLSWYLGNTKFDFNTIITKDIELTVKWNVMEEIFQQVFTVAKLTDNLTINTYYDTAAGQMYVRWSSDKPTFINMITGEVNLDYDETIVKVTGEFVIGKYAFALTKDIIVDKLNFVDLSTIKPAIGYFYSRTASCEISQVTIDTLDIINYGFARVDSDFTVDISELSSIERITALRKQGIRVLLCFGGYGNAGTNFALAANTKAGRQKLAQSMLEIIQEYHFDGVDIDWEYPGYETGQDVSVDRPNYTLLLQEISDTLKGANPNYLVTAALPGGKYGYTRYEIRKIANILDYVNLMTYDLQSSNVSTHHTALYNSGSYTPHGSVDQTVELYNIQGVPKNKLIIGIAFYGRRFVIESNDSGIGKNNTLSSASAITYTSIYNDYLLPIKNGSTTIKRYWDNTAKAPYIYDGRTWISYDDPESIKYKCQYVLDNDLGGLMFWDYGEDETLQLIQAIHDNFR